MRALLNVASGTLRRATRTGVAAWPLALAAPVFCLWAASAGAASFFAPDRADVIDTLSAPEMADIRARITQRASAVTRWEFPASTNPANRAYVPVGPDFDWATNPTDDPEFLHAAFRFEWAEDMVLHDAVAGGGLARAALNNQLASLQAHLETIGDPASSSEIAWTPAWRRINVAIRAWSLLRARALLPPDAGTSERQLFDDIIAADLAWLNSVAEERLRSTDERLTNWDVLIGRALVAGGSIGRDEVRLDRGFRLLLRTIDQGIRPDGMHWEASIHYHLQVARWYAEAGLVARAHGIEPPPELIETTARMADVARNFVHADGREPAIGDSDRDRLNRVALLYASRLLQTPPPVSVPGDALLAHPGTEPVAPQPLPLVHVLADSGYAIVRSHDRKGSLILDFGPTGGWHGHLDLFSFELFSHGAMLVVDPGRWMYRKADPDRRWVLSTPAHNTISIGGTSHRPVETNEDFQDLVEIVAEAATDDGWMMHLRHHAYAEEPNSPVVERLVSTNYDGTYRFNDRISASGPVPVSISLLVPTQSVVQDGGRFRVDVGETRFTLDAEIGPEWRAETEPSWHSPQYGQRRPATRIVFSAVCAPCSLTYTIRVDPG